MSFANFFKIEAARNATCTKRISLFSINYPYTLEGERRTDGWNYRRAGLSTPFMRFDKACMEAEDAAQKHVNGLKSTYDKISRELAKVAVNTASGTDCPYIQSKNAYVEDLLSQFR